MKVAVPITKEPKGDGLLRELNLFGAVSMIVGIVIGSGIFLSVNRVAQGTGSPAMIVALWVIAGIMTLMGALTYAELGTIFPRAGGEYVFLKEGMGSLAAFMSGWVAFTINLAGSAAALAIVFANQLFVIADNPGGTTLFDVPGSFFPPFTTARLFAICLIAALSLINYYGVKYGGGVQMVFTVAKGLVILGLAIAALTYAGDALTPGTGFFESTDYQAERNGEVHNLRGFDWSFFISVAMVGALFAYDGWTNVVRVGSELKEPGKNIPKAMLLGLVAVMVLYIAITIGYLNVLGYQGLADANLAGINDSARTVATNTANTLFGGSGQNIVAGMILVSVFGALNGITMSGPRIYYAMARDRIFPSIFSQLTRHKTPGWAILFQAILGAVFLLFFDFEALTDNVVFISFFFYGLSALGLLVLRRTHPNLHRPYKVPGYPYVPIAYVAIAFSFVGYLIYDQVVNFSGDNFNRLFSFLVVLAGLPIFFWYRAKAGRLAVEEGKLPPPPLFGPDPHADERALAQED